MHATCHLERPVFGRSPVAFLHRYHHGVQHLDPLPAGISTMIFVV